MSLTALRNRSSKYVQVITIVAAAGMVVAAFTGLGQSVFNSRNTAANQSPDDVVATVAMSANIPPAPITRGAFEKKLQTLESGQPLGLFSYCYMNANALDQAVGDVLTVQIAKSKGLSVTNADLDAGKKAVISEIAVSLGLSAKASESEVSDKLAENQASLDQYYNEDEVRHDLLMNKYRDYLRSTNKITEDDVKQQYTDYHTAHILIGKQMPDAEALARANKIIDQLNKGGDFAALAKQYSDDKLSGAGGDDGWITKDDRNPLHPPEFLAAAKALQKGQITQQPVQSPQFGYFIIKLLDTRTNLPADFEKNKASEIEQLQNTRMQDAYEADLTKAQASEKLVIKDDRLRLDHGVMDLYKHEGPAGKVDQGELQKLIKGYTALARSVKGDSDQVAQIDAELGELENLTDKDAKTKVQLQIADFAAALNAYGHDDAGVDGELAALYQQNGDKSNAVKYLTLESGVTFSSPQEHMQFAKTFQTLGRPDLAAKEMQIAAQQQAQQPAQPPGGQSMPVAMRPSAAAAHGQQVTIGGKPVPPGAISFRPGTAGSVRPLGSQTIQVLPPGANKGGPRTISITPGGPNGGNKPVGAIKLPVTVRPVQAPLPVAPPQLTKPSVLFNPLPKPPPPPAKPTTTTPAKPTTPAPAKPPTPAPAPAAAPAKQ